MKSDWRAAGEGGDDRSDEGGEKDGPEGIHQPPFERQPHYDVRQEVENSHLSGPQAVGPISDGTLKQVGERIHANE